VSRPRSGSQLPATQRAPARTSDDRENQLISLAYDLAEKQIRAGTASSQVITQFLKLGSSRERAEQEKIMNENALLATKKELMESQKAVEALYADALNAMRAYSGQPAISQEPDYDDFENPDVF
jgi:hypothetical protein